MHALVVVALAHFCDLSLGETKKAIEPRLKKAKTVTRTLDGCSLEGGEMTAYLIDGRVRKVVTDEAGEMWQGQTVYYFDARERLVWIVKSIDHYRETFKPSGNLTHTRYRFIDGKPATVTNSDEPPVAERLAQRAVIFVKGAHAETKEVTCSDM